MAVDMEPSDDRSSSSMSMSATVATKKSDVSDIELKELSNYFSKSKEEIQKKVDSLMIINFPIPLRPSVSSQSSNNSSNSSSAKSSLTSSSELPPSVSNTSKSESVAPPLLNANVTVTQVSKPTKESLDATKGVGISIETAHILRRLTVGSCVHSFSNDWRRAKLVFRDDNDELSYGLCCQRNGSKGFILAVQTIFIKNLIDDSSSSFKTSATNRLLKPHEAKRKDTLLIRSIVEILWRAGEESYACLTIPNTNQTNSFELPSSTAANGKKINYIMDGFTEKLMLHEFRDKKLIEPFIRKHLTIFQKELGCIYLLYSLILSRQPQRLEKDLQGHKLLGDMEDCQTALFLLVMTGVATPFFHNGNVYYDANGESLLEPLCGVRKRSDIGLLYWNSKEVENKRTEVGSMLKTPKYPIWLALMGKNQMAILFNMNIDLVSDWRMEQYFALQFYSGLSKQESIQIIEIETRTHTDYHAEFSDQQNMRVKYPNFKFGEEDKEVEIVCLIKTKWPGCEIKSTDGKDLMLLL